DDRQMRERLLDARRTAATASGETLHDERIAHIGFGNDEGVGVQAMVVFGIGDGALEHLLHLAGDALVAEFEIGQSPLDLLATDQLRDEVQLLRADAQHAQHSLSLVILESALSLWLAHLLLPLGLLVGRVTVVGTGRRELTELVADHVFGDRHRNMLLTVVDTKGDANELRKNGRATGPDLDHIVAARRLGLLGLLEQIAVDERPLPNRTGHVLPALLHVTAANDELVRSLVRTRTL